MNDKTIIVENNKLRLRIAELEALCSPEAVQRHYMRGYNAANSKRHSYAAELEAERDKFKFALDVIAVGETTDPAAMARVALEVVRR